MIVADIPSNHQGLKNRKPGWNRVLAEKVRIVCNGSKIQLRYISGLGKENANLKPGSVPLPAWTSANFSYFLA